MSDARDDRSDAERAALAFAAAQQAAAALPALLAAAEDGDAAPLSADAPTAVEALSDALKLALEIEGGELAEDERGQLYVALINFLASDA